MSRNFFQIGKNLQQVELVKQLEHEGVKIFSKVVISFVNFAEEHDKVKNF